MIDDAKDAVPLARALLAGGVNAKNMATYLADKNIAALGGS
ncbi:MAG: hypothetical protein NTV93_17665 [Verrucomicrobia bacterium]|nr:hypothetical protein [Verrucomicrobiota bacterium]